MKKIFITFLSILVLFFAVFLYKDSEKYHSIILKEKGGYEFLNSLDKDDVYSKFSFVREEIGERDFDILLKKNISKRRCFISTVFCC